MRRFLLSVCFIFLFAVIEAQVVSADEVHGYIGKTITVYGKIDDGRFLLTSANQPTLLNMGGRFPNQKLTVVIYGNNRANFGYKPEELLINKVVYVTGKVELFKNKPQIVVQNPFEIAFSAPSNKGNTVANKKQEKAEESGKLSRREKKAQEKEIEAIEKSNKEAMERAKKAQLPTPPKEASTDRTESNTVQQKNVAPIIATQPKKGEILLPTSLSLKGGPGTNFTTVGSLKKGTLVKVVSSSYGWTKIMEKNNQDESHAMAGYVRAEKLQ